MKNVSQLDSKAEAGGTLEPKHNANHTCKKHKQWKCQNANANIYQRLRGGAVQTVGGV